MLSKCMAWDAFTITAVSPTKRSGSAGSADYSVGSTLAIILLICVFISTAVMNRFDKDHEEGGNLL